MNSLEIMDQKSQLKERAIEMVKTCRKEIRFFTDEEKAEFEKIENEIRNLNEQMAELQKELNSEEIRNNTDNNIIKENKKKMEKRFSLVGAINSIANNQQIDDVTFAVTNAGKDEMRKAGLSFGGNIQLPVEELRAITVTSEGEDVVPTDLYSIMDPLRAKNVLVQAGAKFLTGLVGDVQIPVMSASNVGWAGEVAAAADGSPAFTHKSLSPKRLTAYIDISKQLLNQDAIGVENMIRMDIVKAINSKLEATILGTSAGTTTQPAGIFYDATVVSGLTGMSEIAEFESAVEEANVLGDCKYIVSPKTKAAFRSLAKGQNIAESLFSNGELDGTPTLSTSHVAANKLVYGDFSNLAIGQWGAIDLTVDNYTQAVNGCVRLVINAYFDAVVLRPEAFAFGSVE